MEQSPPLLVSVAWLDEHRSDPDVAILDVRWALPDGADRESYLAGHIPGARFVDLDQELAGPPGPAGRHPLPEVARFSQAMQAAGVSRGGRVVAYDGGSGAAARAWWLLRAAGHSRAMVLDGGLPSWLAAGHALSAGGDPAEPGDFVADSFQGWISAEETARLLESGEVVLDARSRARFLGQPSALDPRPGHIPGALSFPWTDAYRDGRVIAPAELGQRSAELSGGVVPAAAYCGSGVTACSLILALEAAGIAGVRLYPGSWSEWAQDPGRPAAIGEE
ncbi:MAG TPA: sulfurtransferase [Candidatus Dormibacteraeota bacterium]|nr:sulfurtransferase [Candidatus Dormibacteraeota bacterium]